MKTLISLLFALVLPLSAELPAEAQKLVEIREREINKLNVAYLQKLDALLVDYRAKGDTESVKAIEDLIAAVEKPAKEEVKEDPASDVLAPLVGKWRRDYDNAVFEFFDSKSGSYGGNTPFTMTYNSSTKRVTIVSAKWVDTVSFTLHEDVLKGGHDNKVPYKLTRVK